ncbi:TetR/AcrR family transcriptional regulator [Arcticibacter sp. MXS-1]|uniref:TetR/AcrR family transcriptional regulator n=1 Tax=Arcticibacter sp. MXS-1 TaxID=3341726 RepID=UPI0035A98BE7
MRKTRVPVSEPQKKARKTTSGPVRDKARTMERLITSVGKVIGKCGYPGLTIANIANESGLDRRLIYTYFGTLDNLVEAYLLRKDYWNAGAKKTVMDLLESPQDIGGDEINSLLTGQFETMLKDKAWQKIIHWEIGEKNKILRRLSDSREELGELLFQQIEQYFDRDSVDIRAVMALQIAGIYYLALHAKSNGSTFCGIDINQEDGKERIKRALESITKGAFKKVK